MGYEVGELHKTVNEFEWRIENFFSLSEEADDCYSSPNFCYSGEWFYLEIYPNGYSDDNTAGYVDLCLIYSGSPMRLEISLALKNLNAGKDLERHYATLFNSRSHRHNSFQFISSSELVKRKTELVPSGVLTVVCTLKTLKSSGSGIATGECQYCKKFFNTQEITFHEKKCRIKCPDCSTVILLQNWNIHECQIFRAEEQNLLSENIKDLFINGEFCDIALHVNDKIFKAHKLVLVARSPVFAGMFRHETVEKQTGVINISDCDPNSFQEFLEYIYSDKVNNILFDKAFHLYKTADKYDVQKLKMFCVQHMERNLNVKNILNVIVLAEKYDDTILLAAGQEFFNTNFGDIFVTSEWKELLKKDCNLANKLLIEMSSNVKKKRKMQ